jgi:signal transduction histidine kinase
MGNVTMQNTISTFVKWTELTQVECEPESGLNMGFLALLSYEMRDPLTVISTSRFLLTRYADQLSYETVEKHINIITSQIIHIEELQKDAAKLEYSKTAKVSHSQPRTNLPEFCRQQIKQIQESDAARHIFSIDVDEQLENIGLDEHLLGHIFSNILANAAAYSAAGTEIYLSVSRQDADVVCTVSDQGIGILAEDRPHIFEPFYRGSNISDLQGTGLGLTVAKCCVDAYKGRIEVESQPGKGTTVRVYLPLDVEK